MPEELCACEHTNHFDDERGPQVKHDYYSTVLAGSQKALYVGAICDDCAATCMINYLIRDGE